jgi:hypothetical protein
VHLLVAPIRQIIRAVTILFSTKSYVIVHHLNEIDSDSTAVAVGEVGRVVDQHGHFLGSDFASTVAKHKENGVQHIALPTAVGSNDRRHSLEKN